MQTAAGLLCVLLGCMHFLDRGRHPSEIRSFYFGSFLPKTATARGIIAVIEVLVGFALLFSDKFV